MSNYDRQYRAEPHLFGEPYREFVAFVEALEGAGSALDLGCGQGRDALMLAAHGHHVTGIDASQVAIAQLTERARTHGLGVTGIVGDYYQFEFTTEYDLVVMDSILHFGQDRDKEIGLLDRVFRHVRTGGMVCLFVHRSRTKDRHLNRYLGSLSDGWAVVEDRYIDYVYEETQTGFRSASQFRMVVVRSQEGEKT